ncbi:MAG: CD225/dispanin family protein [Paludibacter sp.]|nr:CD225/dispanin family protein [Paludibacter sp.]
MENFNNNPQGPAPDNNLVWAILVTILCCLPGGIYAIVRATKVNTLWLNGQYDEARKAADDAKKWSIISAIVGGVCIIIWIIIVVLGGFAAAYGNY